MFGSKNRRFTKDGRPVWYIYVDESGTPFYIKPSDRTRRMGGFVGSDPFVIGGLMTDDSESIGKISLEQPRHTKRPKGYRQPPGKGELKHVDSNDRVIKTVIREIDQTGAIPFMVVVEKLDPDTNDVLDTNELYVESIRDLAELIVKYGRRGEYRFRIDDSRYYDQALFEKTIRKVFQEVEGMSLSDDFVRKLDSKHAPQIQTVDILVGERREREERGSGDLFDEKHRIHTRRRRNIRE